jgi:hypothetical protein
MKGVLKSTIYIRCIALVCHVCRRRRCVGLLKNGRSRSWNVNHDSVSLSLSFSLSLSLSLSLSFRYAYHNSPVFSRLTWTSPLTICNNLPVWYVILPNAIETLLVSLSINFWSLTSLTPRCAWMNVECCCACWHCKSKVVFCDRSTCTSKSATADSSRRINTSFFSASLRSKERYTLSLCLSSLSYGTYRIIQDPDITHPMFVHMALQTKL